MSRVNWSMDLYDQQERYLEFDSLMTEAAKWLSKNSHPLSFLNWMGTAGPSLAPMLATQSIPGLEAQVFRSLGVHIYNQMPLPDNQFRPAVFPLPSRNQPCLCGSGKKYKYCCLDMEKLVPMPEDLNLLYFMLKTLPRKELGELPDSQVDAEALAHVAWMWIEEGETQKALALLEPWFKPGVTLNHRQLPLFDLLMDMYLDLNKPIKRKRLAERVCEAEHRQLSAAGWMRRATMEADAGNYAQAWESFAIAQKRDPDSQDLAVLEITLLYAESRLEQAKARARFWLVRLRRSRQAAPEILDWLEQVALDPAAAMPDVMADFAYQYEVNELEKLLDEAPEPVACYSFERYDDGVCLVAPAKLRKLEQQWYKAAKPVKPIMTDFHNDDLGFWERSEQWLVLLKKHPELWNSFNVLDDLVMGIDTLMAHGLDEDDEADELLELFFQLLERAYFLLCCQLEQVPEGERWTMPWIIPDNRPALRMLVNFAVTLEGMQGHSDEFVPLAELALTLNPEDNHGMRYSLSTAYLVLQQPQKALDLSTAYQGDAACILPLNMLLALWQLDRKEEAGQFLHLIAPDYKTALDMLLARAPRQPELQEGGFILGGEDEAWLYRNQTYELWKSSGALAWLKKALKDI